MVFSKTGQSAEKWELKSALLQQFLYNDNISLSSTQKQSVFGYIATPYLQISRETKSLNTTFNGQGEIQRYDNELWDCENYNLGLNNKLATRQGDFMFNARYGTSCAYSQQAQITGVIIPTAQATFYNVAPSWSWQLSSRDQLNATAVYNNTSYSGIPADLSASERNAASVYIDYETYLANLSLSHAWSRRLILNGAVVFSNDQYKGITGSTQNALEIQSGGQYLLSKNWSAKLSAGIRWTDIQYNASASDNAIVNPVGAIDLIYNGQLDHFSVGFSSTVLPSSIGQTLQTQSAHTKYSHTFDHKISLHIDANVDRNETLGNNATLSGLSYNRDSASATLGLSWEPAKNWTIKGSYSYRWQKLLQQGFQGSSDGNVYALSLNYNWDGIRN